jgi:hypothetical protein
MDKWGSPARESTANFWIKKKNNNIVNNNKILQTFKLHHILGRYGNVDEYF